MSTYSFVRESCIQGVLRSLALQPRNAAIPPPLDRIRAIFDASVFAINSQTAQAYAAREDRRELLRVARTLTFTSGDASLPNNTLKVYIEDCTFYVPSTPLNKYSYRPYPDWLRGGDPRLGLWTQVGDTIKAKTPTPITAFSGSAAFSSIESPPVPTSESSEYVCPDDFIPDFEAAMIQYILGEIMETAAQTA